MGFAAVLGVQGQGFKEGWPICGHNQAQASMSQKREDAAELFLASEIPESGWAKGASKRMGDSEGEKSRGKK